MNDSFLDKNYNYIIINNDKNKLSILNTFKIYF